MAEYGYRLVTFEGANAQPKAGVLVGSHLYDPSDLCPTVKRELSVIDILRNWDEIHPVLDTASQSVKPADGTRIEDVRLLPPVLYPGAFYCAGANYWDHLEEMAEIARRTTGQALSMTKGAEPWFFMKTAAGAMVGHQAAVRLPSFSKQVDWEAEVGIVIGRKTRNIPEGRAMEAVAGFVIVNDLSARDLMKRDGTPFIYDWIGQKCFDDGAPIGPWLTPAAYVRDPHDLDIKLWVNGVLKQNSNTSRLVHDMAEQIAYLSCHVTLWPGDVIATGTPAGVGMPRGEFLKPGDEVRIEVAGCGTLINRMIADG